MTDSPLGMQDDIDVNEDAETVLVPLYTGINQRFILQWMRENSRLRAAGRDVARCLVGDFYSARTSDAPKIVAEKEGYAFPSYKVLQATIGRGQDYVRRGINQLKESGEWAVIPGYGGRPFEKKEGRAWTPSQRTRGLNSRYYPILPWADLPKGCTVEWVAEPMRRGSIVLPEWCTPEGYEAFLRGDAPVVPEPPQETPTAGSVADDTLVQVALTVTQLSEFPPIEAYDDIEAYDAHDLPVDDYVPVYEDAADAPEETVVTAQEPVVAEVQPPQALTDLNAALTEEERPRMAKATPEQLEALALRVAEVQRQGDLHETLRQARERQRQQGEVVMSMPQWLLSYALKRPRAPRANQGAFSGMRPMRSVTEMEMSGEMKDIDYGVSGQEF